MEQLFNEVLGPLKDWPFVLKFLTGFFCIICPLGLISNIVINRSLAFGFKSTLPVILSALVGDAVTCVVVASGMTYISNLITGNEALLVKFFSSVLLLLGLRGVVNLYRRGPNEEKRRPHPRDNWIAFWASVFNPANYIVFGIAAAHTAPSLGTPHLYAVISFTLPVVAGCLAAWCCTASYMPLLEKHYGSSDKFQAVLERLLIACMIIVGCFGLGLFGWLFEHIAVIAVLILAVLRWKKDWLLRQLVYR